MTTQRIKVGIAGLGRAGWGIHAQALAGLPELFNVAAVCDPDRERQAEAQDRFGCRAYDDLDGLLTADVELVVVATPSQMHADDTIQALQAGKHVLVEKPMALSVANVDAMIATAQHTDRLLTVNQNYRYAPDYAAVKEIMDSGVLGRVLQVRIAVHQFSRRWDWQTLKDRGGGILNNHGAHVVDWALLLFDDPQPQLFCRMEATPLYAGDADSHVKLVLLPQDGPLVDIELTHACAYPQTHMLVMGTQGSLASDRNIIRWKYFVPAEAPPLVLDTKPTPDRSYNREQLPWHEDSLELARNFGDEARQLYRDLHAALLGTGPLVITPESVRRQMVILERCRELSPV